MLSFGNLTLAIALFSFGLSEYQAARKANPNASLIEGVYIPTGHVVSYCLNAPSFVISNAIRNALMGHALPGTSIHYGYIEYYVTIFIFWWCLGWQLDLRSGRDTRPQIPSLVVNLLGVLLALAFLGIGLSATWYKILPVQAISISLFIWGCALIWYFGRRLLVRVGHRHTDFHPTGDPEAR
jgi:hypothetical protein